jgi:hypothetical protein
MKTILFGAIAYTDRNQGIVLAAVAACAVIGQWLVRCV